jgi:hydroxymethylglutaryl-CoA lyase
MSTMVRVNEVGLRDGLQSLAVSIPTERKARLVEALIDAGVREFDVASFVDPKRVPQVADSDALMALLPRRDDVRYMGLVLNLRGVERALAAGVDRLGVLTQASETFSQRNANCSVDESLTRIAAILEARGADGPPARGYVACAVDCPYEGPVAPDWVAELAERLLELGCDEVSLGETIGTATPPAMARVLDAVLTRVPAERLGVHLHDTFGQGIANLAVCLERGVRFFDSSFAGIGGCPFAPGASGNVATEDAVYLLSGLGLESGVDMTRVAEAGAAFCREFDISVNSKAGRGLVARAARPANA